MQYIHLKTHNAKRLFFVSYKNYPNPLRPKMQVSILQLSWLLPSLLSRGSPASLMTSHLSAASPAFVHHHSLSQMFINKNLPADVKVLLEHWAPAVLEHSTGCMLRICKMYAWELRIMEKSCWQSCSNTVHFNVDD